MKVIPLRLAELGGGFRGGVQLFELLQESIRHRWMALEMVEGSEDSLPLGSMLRSSARRRALGDSALLARCTDMFGRRAQL